MTPKHLLRRAWASRVDGLRRGDRRAGPAGLATAIHLKQLNPELSVIVLEKGSEPGAHIISGAVMDPHALTELIPDWKARGAPLNQPVVGDDVLILTETGSRRIPDFLVPRNFHNDGCTIVRLGYVVKWLAEQAEALGVEIFPGFAADEILYAEDGSVRGVATGTMGVGKGGEAKDSLQLGMELTGRYPSSPKGRAASSAGSSSTASSSPRARTRRPTRSASRNCGRFPRTRPSRGASCTPPAGRWAARRSAAASSTTSRAGSCRSASSSASTTRIRG